MRVDLSPRPRIETILLLITVLSQSHDCRLYQSPHAGFWNVKPQKLAAHLRQDRYGDFWLTEAIRPAPRHRIVPRQGYRLETYRDPSEGAEIPVLAAAISREGLFDAFLDLLIPLGEVVDVILETSHDSNGPEHRDLLREAMDLPVLQSHLCDFEDLLLHDGCTGVAILSTDSPMEVQFDEHKLLIVYAHQLEPFEEILLQHGVARDDRLKLITEGQHLHNTSAAHQQSFERLCLRLGVGKRAEHLTWW